MSCLSQTLLYLIYIDDSCNITGILPLPNRLNPLYTSPNNNIAAVTVAGISENIHLVLIVTRQDDKS